MAAGAITHSNGDIGISVTGIAGPGGGSNEKPVGLVHMAIGLKGSKPLHERQVFSGSRTSVRMATIEYSLLFINKAL